MTIEKKKFFLTVNARDVSAVGSNQIKSFKNENVDNSYGIKNSNVSSTCLLFTRATDYAIMHFAVRYPVIFHCLVEDS